MQRCYKLQSYVEVAENFSKLIDRTENYRQFCFDKQSEADRMLTDLDYKLELSSLDAVQMVKICSRRKQILKERRFVKDEIERVNTIINKMGDSQQLHKKIQTSCAEMRALEKRLSNRKFTPRILTDEFK